MFWYFAHTNLLVNFERFNNLFLSNDRSAYGRSRAVVALCSGGTLARFYRFWQSHPHILCLSDIESCLSAGRTRIVSLTLILPTLAFPILVKFFFQLQVYLIKIFMGFFFSYFV